MNDIERAVTKIIAGILLMLKQAKTTDLSRDIEVNCKKYKISLTNDADFVLYRIEDPENYTPLAAAYDGIDNVSEAIDIIARRIEIDH